MPGSGAPCENGPVSEQAGRYQRSATGMIGALLVLLGVIAGFVVFREIIREDPESPVTAVDYQQPLGFAREQAGFPVLAPERLPDGWRATTVDFSGEPPRWHLGVLTDEDRYVGLEQARSSEKSMLTTYVDADPTQGEDVTVAGQAWQTWTDDGGDTALLRTDGEVTTLVVSSASQDVLVDYVRNLR
jgi:hypothetical protein